MSRHYSFARAAAAILVAGALSTTCRETQSPQEAARGPATLQASTAPAATVTLVGAGTVASCSSTGDEATATIIDTVAGTVFVLGDNVYPSGSLANYQNCYNPSWGRHKTRTRPALGNHEYDTSPTAADYFTYFGANAGDPTTGYYSYDVGAWHIVVLNSQVSTSATSAQVQWLRANLAANQQHCTLAYWHDPRFSSGTTYGSTAQVQPLWQALYDYRADIVLSGHEHNYERFASQTPTGLADAVNGIREFVVGTGGGSSTYPFGTPIANSEVRITGTYGVLRLTLADGTYAWKFIPVAGKTATDAGSGTCHAPPAPVAKPGGPYSTEGQFTVDGSASTGFTPLTYAWEFGDGTTGSGTKPSHTYTTFGTYTVTLTVTDSRGTQSTPATTTATFGNFPPTVTVGSPRENQFGDLYTLNVSFSDPGPDSPWTYSVAWGDGSLGTSGSVTTQSPLVVTHTYAARGTYPVHVSVTDAGGAQGATDANVVVRTAFVGAGDIANCTVNGDSLTANLLDTIPGTVFAAGDNAYPDGTSTDFTNCYGPTWGRHKARTRPVPGNHEYNTPGASGYFGYFGAAAGDPSKGYYSYDLGDWHVIALNSNIARWAGSPQEQWLRADLASSTKRCTLAYMHAPLFSSGTLADTTVRPMWQDLYAAGAEIVVAGHEHNYQRFAPQTPTGVADQVTGIRELIAGMGGDEHFNVGTPLPNTQVQNDKAFGVLKLTLYSTGYDWQFIPIAGQTFTDAGSGTCHDAPSAGNHAPTAAAGGPYSGAEGSAVSFDGSGSSDPDGDAITYAWSFGDGASATAVNPSHTYADNGSYTVTLTVTDARGATSAPATTTATVANAAPVVSTAASQAATVGSPFTLTATFSDVGGNDTPWAYAIDWGDGSPQTTGSAASQTNAITATHTYAAAGTDNARVSVTDKDGGAGSATATVTVSAAANHPPTAAPGGPYAGTEGSAVSFDGSGSSDPDGDAITYAWSFGDGSNGTGVRPSHSYANNGSYTVTLTVTDARGAASALATTTATIANAAPVVNAGANQTATAGSSFTLSASFSDAGVNDAPWSYAITWGDGSPQTAGSTSSQANPITAPHTYSAAGTYTVQVSVTDRDGGSGAGSKAVTVTVSSATTVTLVGAGTNAACGRTFPAATAAILDTVPGTVFTTGDDVYPSGSLANYVNCYDPTWGRHKARTRPSLGNHDYDTSPTAADYFTYYGASAGDPTKGYYSYDVGAWHVAVLNSMISMSAGSPQEGWLRADLAASTKRCQLAYWHYPRFSSDTTPGSITKSQPMWQALYDFGAEIVIAGHEHNYERFAPQTPTGVADPVNGIREFVIGTGGGASQYDFGPTIANSEVRITYTPGVLRLTLGDGTYAWKFIPIAGYTATDSGSGVCH